MVTPVLPIIREPSATGKATRVSTLLRERPFEGLRVGKVSMGFSGMVQEILFASEDLPTVEHLARPFKACLMELILMPLPVVFCFERCMGSHLAAIRAEKRRLAQRSPAFHGRGSTRFGCNPDI
jgi:hypothetical protein